MQYGHDGLMFWYGTDDAPAPDGVEARSGVSLTVGVQPPNPSNAVSIRFRVDNGLVQTVRAVRQRTDFTRKVEYYRALFPHFWSGDAVAYLPIVTCAGRRAPDPETAATFPSSFRLAGPQPTVARTPSERPIAAASTPWVPERERLPFRLDYLASLRVPLRPPELIGTTPEGIKAAWYWYPEEGVVVGPKLNGKVRRFGGDWMTIRPDGIGLIDVRATIETHDGALLYVSYPGYIDMGENGYQNFLNKQWPTRAPTRTVPQFDVADSRYLWLNRLQCLGIGEVRMDELVYVYDLYGVF